MDHTTVTENPYPEKMIPTEDFHKRDLGDPYKRDSADMNPRELSFSDLMLAIMNAVDIANVMREDVMYDQAVREIALVQTKLDEARLWALEGQSKFVKPPVM